ncbi:hypothetical protein B0I75DRAFT_138346 [Yarrowia lipolytica]|nr:hypothetical protein B0I74DRAFT_142298 [Yarrowia lipolytica]RDW52338.1 hypothetical protein B0I75DRAFT_138346 [Yarrowia lipolytica]
MEKFSQYRDKGTGVAPYLPHPRSKADGSLPSTIFVVLQAPLALVESVIKIPLLLALLALYGGIIQFITIEPVRKAYFSTLLFVSGFWFWNVSAEAVRRNKLTEAYPKPGEVVVSNYLSPIDAFVYSALFDPVFIVPHASSRVYQELGPFGVFFKALGIPEIVPPTHGESLSKIVFDATSKGRAVVVFAEGTTSNGRGLLPLLHIDFHQLSQNTKVIPAGLRLAPQYITTPLPVTLPMWVFRLLSNPTGWHVSLRFAEPCYAKDTNVNNTLVESICRVGRLKSIGPDLGVEGKRNFWKVYNKKKDV